MHPLAELAEGNLHIDKQLARDFFIVFARFEYAMKENGHVVKGPSERDLELRFNDLARSLDGKFQARISLDKALSAAVAYYREKPPKKQIWDGAKPDWKESYQTEPLCHLLLILISRTRNNLFHGGKGYRSESEEIGRDEELITHALTIIDAILECDESMKHSFSSLQ